MNIQRTRVTISLNLDINDLPAGVTLEQVAEMMTHDQWSEGRYPFYTEMLHEGLRKVVLAAISEATFKLMLDRHPGEYVKYTTEYGHGETSVAYLEQEKAMKTVGVYNSDSIKAAGFGEPNDSSL